MSQDPRSSLSNAGRDFVKSHHDTYPFIDPKKQDLSGRHVFVTGASRGIGKQTAVAYAKAGASCIAIGARSDLSSQVQDIVRAATEAGHNAPTVVSVSLDITSRESVEAAAHEMKTKIGHLDVIINNAGVLEPFKQMLDQDPDVWWNTWETNIKGTFLVLRAFLPLLLESQNKERTVVSLTSTGAHVAWPGASAYQTSKLAMIRLMEFVNAEYGKQGILAYAVHPGGVDTDMGRTMGPDYSQYLVDTPELSAHSIVWLTAERREWLAGRYVSCTWDMEQFEAKKEEIIQGDLLKVRMAVE